MRDTYAWALWLRGTSVVWPHNEELIDRMAPIYFSRLGNVSPTTMSVNLDKDETSQSMDPAYVAIQSADSLDIFSQGNKLPYIAAVHCYALTENQGITVAEPNLGRETYDDEAPRHQIDFRGLSAYRNMTDGVSAAIRRMMKWPKNALFISSIEGRGMTWADCS